MNRIFYVIFLFALYSCQTVTESYDPEKIDSSNANLIHELNQALIKVVSEDLFSPPVASRIYAYTNVAAYEAARHLGQKPSLADKLNGLTPLAIDTTNVYWEVAMVSSFCKVAKHLVYRDFLIDSVLQSTADTLKANYSDADVFSHSLEVGSEIAGHIIKWADQDGYNATRNLARYEPLDATYAWEATAPTYGEALEPHWFKLRPFVMDSASQFRVDLPLEFSTDPNSAFYAASQEVYQMVNKAEQKDIDVAVYWDCNPGPTLVNGHLMQVRKQNTPGGHWVGIHSIIAKKQNATLSQSCAIYAKMCSGIADAFIAAWDTKYAHHLLRPETYINRHIDKDWKPKLESPLFPEFTSAHSLVSAVAASVLADAYGEVPFYDNTNVSFGLPPKQFPNVWNAAEEAALSRLLGGIHYVFGCENGLAQGKKLGQLVNQRITLDSPHEQVLN